VDDIFESKGGKLHLTIGVIDQFGEEYQLNKIINSNNCNFLMIKLEPFVSEDLK